MMIFLATKQWLNRKQTQHNEVLKKVKKIIKGDMF